VSGAWLSGKPVRLPIMSILADGKRSRRPPVGYHITLLKRSIEKRGQDTPVIVRPINDRSFEYELVTGFARYYAISKLNIDILAIVQNLNDTQVREIQNVREQHRRSEGSSNASRLADLVYELLKDSVPHLDIDLVRPPNPAHGDAVAVLFSDGRDVVITFTEKK